MHSTDYQEIYHELRHTIIESNSILQDQIAEHRRRMLLSKNVTESWEDWKLVGLI